MQRSNNGDVLGSSPAAPRNPSFLASTQNADLTAPSGPASSGSDSTRPDSSPISATSSQGVSFPLSPSMRHTGKEPLSRWDPDVPDGFSRCLMADCSQLIPRESAVTKAHFAQHFVQPTDTCTWPTTQGDVCGRLAGNKSRHADEHYRTQRCRACGRWFVRSDVLAKHIQLSEGGRCMQVYETMGYPIRVRKPRSKGTTTTAPTKADDDADDDDDAMDAEEAPQSPDLEVEQDQSRPKGKKLLFA
jgi:hypothetical protein